MVTSGCSLSWISFLLVTLILFRLSLHLPASGSIWIISDFPLASLSQSASLKPDSQLCTHPHGRSNRHLKLAVVPNPISETFSGWNPLWLSSPPIHMWVLRKTCLSLARSSIPGNPVLQPRRTIRTHVTEESQLYKLSSDLHAFIHTINKTKKSKRESFYAEIWLLHVLLYFTFIYSSVCKNTCLHPHATQYMWRSEENLQALVLSCGTRDQLCIRLGGKSTDPPGWPCVLF